MTDELCLYEAGEKNDWFIVIAAHSANAVLSELWEKGKKESRLVSQGKEGIWTVPVQDDLVERYMMN